MATFTFTGQLFDITFAANNPDVARSLRAQSATLVLESTDDIGFFSYRTLPSDGELPDIDIFRDNLISAKVNGEEVINSNDINASIGTIGVNGGTGFFLALNDEVSDTRENLAVFLLDGDPLPNITSAARFNNIINTADFGVGTGAFAPGTRIELNDLDGAVIGASVPLETGTDEGDVIAGDDDADNIDAGGGDDSVDGGGGNDTISGGGGADTITGGGGSDDLSGGGGADDLNGGGGRDTIQGGGGRDKLIGGGGADELQGGGGRDFLDGKGGRDSVDGGGGRDMLFGGGGADTLEGGRGVDELTGGRGRDVFEFALGSGRDTVKDYRDGQDKFMIGQGATEFADLNITQRGDDAQIAFANVRILVEDTDADQLTANDFLFG